jgi:Trypsin
LCSGTLIKPDVVLTAAHCTMRRAAYRVTGLDRTFMPATARVISINAHPDFVPGTTPRNQPGIDLSVLKLNKPLGDGFTPLNVNRARSVWSGLSVKIAGYGLSSERTRRTARVLREADLVIKGAFDGSANRVLVASDAETLAQTSGKGACLGDSGGPVLAGDTGSYQLLGVISWSGGPYQDAPRALCGGLTALTPVAEHVEWINSQLREMGPDSAVEWSVGRE